jgi:hypothetical protein
MTFEGTGGFLVKFILKDLAHMDMILHFLIAQHTRHKFYDSLSNVHIWCQNALACLWWDSQPISHISDGDVCVCVDVIYNSCHIFLCFADRCWSWAFSILDIHRFTFVLWKPIECFNCALCYQNVTHIISNVFSMNHILTIQLCLTHH